MICHVARGDDKLLLSCKSIQSFAISRHALLYEAATRKRRASQGIAGHPHGISDTDLVVPVEQLTKISDHGHQLGGISSIPAEEGHGTFELGTKCPWKTVL